MAQVDSPEDSRGEDKAKRNLAIGKIVMNKLRLLGWHKAEVGIIEYPSFQSSTKGKIAAMQGYTFGLAWVAGYIMAHMPETEWYLPTPIEWKGTQNKDAMAVKFTYWTGLPSRFYSDHQYEAALMLKWYLDNHNKKT